MQERKLDNDEIKTKLALMLSSNSEIEGLFNELIEQGGWALKAIEPRFKAHNMESDKKVAIFIFLLADSTIGKIAKVVDFCARWCHYRNIDSIDLLTFNKIFPNQTGPKV